MWDFPTVSSLISELPDKVHINMSEFQVASESILPLYTVSFASYIHSSVLYLPLYYILKEVWKDFRSICSTSLSSSFLWTGSSKPHTSHWSQVWQLWGSGLHPLREETVRRGKNKGSAQTWELLFEVEVYVAVLQQYWVQGALVLSDTGWHYSWDTRLSCKIRYCLRLDVFQ